MRRSESIATMQRGLFEALAGRDWARARRYINRLKGIVIDSLVQNDSAAIQLATDTLRQAGRRLELEADLPMNLDETALAWQLRADAETGALAGRVRPQTSETVAEPPGDVPGVVLDELRRSNGPMSNASLADRTGKDPAVITRALKRLESEQKIRSWRGLRGQRLNAVVTAAATKPAIPTVNSFRHIRIDVQQSEAMKDTQAQSIRSNSAWINSADASKDTHNLYNSRKSI